MNTEIVKQLQLNYWDHCRYLQLKYGLPPRDYYCNELCISKSKNITRTAEGLVIHHNAEGLNVGNLGEPHLAKLYPFEFQKKENLSYCNLIEHLLLHLKINARCCSSFAFPFELKYFFNSLGFFWIGNFINTLFKEQGSAIKWQDNCFRAIYSLFDDYISILKGVLCFLDNNYTGEKRIQIAEGKQLFFDVIDQNIIDFRQSFKERRYTDEKNIKSNYKQIPFIINRIIPDKDTIEILLDGRIIEKSLSELQAEFDYNIKKKCYTDVMCSLGDGSIWSDLVDIVSKPYSLQEENIAVWIKENSD